MSIEEHALLLRLLIPTLIVFGGYFYVTAQLWWPFAPLSIWTATVAAAFPALHYVGFFLRFRKVGGRGADAVSWLSYLALGFFALLFTLSVARDALMLLAYGLNLVVDVLPDDRTALWQYAAYAVWGLGFVLFVQGVFGARRVPRFKRVDVKIAGLAPDFDGFSIAQLTDVHIGPTIKRNFIEAVVKKTNSANPNAIVITGDLVDGPVDELRHDAEPLSRLSATEGVYFVTGNHEFYTEVDKWVAHLRELGLNVLENDHHVIARGGARLAICGVHDRSAQSMHPEKRMDVDASLRGLSDDTPRVFTRTSASGGAPSRAKSSGPHAHGAHPRGANLPMELLCPLAAAVRRGLGGRGRNASLCESRHRLLGATAALFSPQ